MPGVCTLSQLYWIWLRRIASWQAGRQTYSVKFEVPFTPKERNDANLDAGINKCEYSVPRHDCFFWRDLLHIIYMLKFSWNVDSCMCLVSYASWTPWLTQPFVAQGLRYWQICNGIFASTAFRARAFQAVASQATSLLQLQLALIWSSLPFLSFNISSWVEFLLGLLHVKTWLLRADLPR